MASQEKMTTKKIFTRNKQEISRNEVKPLERRNLSPLIVPEDVDNFRKISESQILNINLKIPEFFQEFLSEESFSESGKNILKYTKSKHRQQRILFQQKINQKYIMMKKLIL